MIQSLGMLKIYLVCNFNTAAKEPEKVRATLDFLNQKGMKTSEFEKSVFFFLLE